MPIHHSYDAEGPYYQFGDSGERYHYKAGNLASEKHAHDKAVAQMRAEFAHGYEGHHAGSNNVDPATLPNFWDYLPPEHLALALQLSRQ